MVNRIEMVQTTVDQRLVSVEVHAYHTSHVYIQATLVIDVCIVSDRLSINCQVGLYVFYLSPQ